MVPISSRSTSVLGVDESPIWPVDQIGSGLAACRIGEFEDLLECFDASTVANALTRRKCKIYCGLLNRIQRD